MLAQAESTIESQSTLILGEGNDDDLSGSGEAIRL
jgi:hypothetical protein